MSKAVQIITKGADSFSRRKFIRLTISSTAALAGALAGSQLTVLAGARAPSCPSGTHAVHCCCLISYTSCCACCGCGCPGHTPYAWYCTDIYNQDYQCYECPNNPIGSICSSANYFGHAPLRHLPPAATDGVGALSLQEAERLGIAN
jgi:hypothetical protein